MLFLLKCKPVSVNRSHYRSGRKTVEYRDFISSVNSELIQYRPSIRHFLSKYNDEELNVNIVYGVPTCYTKKGAINKRGSDIDNLNKSTIDAVFKNIDIDDSHIFELTCSKMPSIEWSVRIEIDIL